MKKHMKYMFFCVMACLLVVVNSVAQYNITLVEERGGEIVLNFTLSQYEVKDVVVNGEVCNYVNIPRSVYPAQKGLPNLPRICRSVLIPNTAAMGLEIVDIQYKELGVKTIVPSKGRIYRHQNPANIPFTFGNTYTKDMWYPETAAWLGTPYILRDIRGIAVYFQPVSYNAVQGKIKIAESITVKVKTVGAGKINVLKSKFKTIAPAFEKIYNHQFINYTRNRTRYPEVADGDKMVILCPSNFTGTMQPLVDWKNKKGIKTDMYEYPGETGGEGADNVKSFILSKYESDNVTYFLLVGDHGDLPASLMTMGADDVGVDPINVLMAGGDRYADAFIGRFSASSTSDIQTIVNKTLKYEQEPDESGDWYHKATGIGSNEGDPKDWEWLDDMRDVMLAYNYTEVDQIYDSDGSNATASQLSTAINAGRSWVNYMGHANWQIWATSNFLISNITSLSNGDKQPIIVAVSCYNGQFHDKTTCFAEAFVKQSQGGCVIFHGAANSQDWKPPQNAQKEMVKLLCEDKYISAGAIIFNGMMKMVEVWDNNDKTYEGWNVFGDPSIMPFTDKPDELTVTCPSEIPQGTSKFKIDFGKADIDGRVCLYDATGKTIAGAAVVSDASSVEIDADVPDVDKITLVVTARNKVPYEKEINVGPSSIGTVADAGKNLKLQAFPNPFRATTNISFNNPAKNALVTIYSSAGRMVVSAKVTGNFFKWDAKNQTSGLYIVRVKTNNKVVEKNICLIK